MEADAAATASRGSAIKLSADVTGRLLGFGATVLITRSLTVGELSRFELASAVAVIAAEAADLGLQATAGRDLAAGRVSLRAVLRAKLLLSVVAFVALSIVVRVSGLGSLAVPLIVYFILGGWAEWLGVVLRVRGRPALEAVTLLAFRASVLSAVAAAIAWGASLTGLAWTHAVAPFAALVLSASLVSRVGGGGSGPDVATAAVFRSALPLAANGLLAILSLRIEVLALGLWGGEGDVGLFSTASKLVAFLLVIPAAVCAGAMPAMVRETMRGERAVRDHTAATLALIAAPAAMGLWLVPGVVSLFGAQYAGAAGLVRIVAFAVPCVFMNALMLHALIAAGRGGRVTRLTGVRVLIAVLAAVVLVPAAGAAGAAAGFTLAELAMFALGWRACADAGVAVPVRAPLLRGAALSLPMAAVVGLLDAPDLVRVAAGLAAYAVTLIGAKISGSAHTIPR